jgi:hypothetical protein
MSGRYAAKTAAAFRTLMSPSTLATASSCVVYQSHDTERNAPVTSSLTGQVREYALLHAGNSRLAEDIRTTANQYGHLFQETQREMAERMGRLILSEAPPAAKSQ